MKRELPFKCIVLDEPEQVSNIFTGESILLSPDAVAVYDVLMGAQLFAEGAEGEKAEKAWDIVRAGLNWFRKHEPKAYMVLLD